LSICARRSQVHTQRPPIQCCTQELLQFLIFPNGVLPQAYEKLPAFIANDIQLSAETATHSALRASDVDMESSVRPDPVSQPASTAASHAASSRLLRLEQVLNLCGLGRTLVYDLIGEQKFPAPVKVGRSSLWLEREIYAWIEQLVASRDSLRPGRAAPKSIDRHLPALPSTPA